MFFTIKSPQCWLCLALICYAGCSKKQETGSGAITNETSQVDTPKKLDNQQRSQTRFATEQTTATTGAVVPVTGPAAKVESASQRIADAKIASSPAEIAKMLKDTGDRETAYAAIRHMQNPDSVDGLLAILSDQKVISSTDPLGLATVDTLGIIGTPTAVSNLFLHLSSLREGATSPVYDSIGRVSNPEALPLIASVAYGQVAGSSLYARMAAVQALGNYSSNAVYPALNWLIQNDPNAGIREAAGQALGRAAGP